MKGRFAPSPTGYMHLGNLWIALLSYISVRRQQGSFLLRIEDIDFQRSRPHFAVAIQEDLRRCGIEWDEEPIFQSQRYSRYQDWLEKWGKKGCIYPCYCTRARLQSIGSAPHLGDRRARYDGSCRQRLLRKKLDRQPSIRLKVENRSIVFHDRWKGMLEDRIISCEDDIVLRRSDGMYAYQLAVTIDDFESGITEVVRGYDLLSSTTLQLYLHELLGNTNPPLYAHAPLLVDHEGYRLSKRQSGITLRELFEKGETVESLLGYLAYITGVLPIEKGEKASLEEWMRYADIEHFKGVNIVVDHPLV